MSALEYALRAAIAAAAIATAVHYINPKEQAQRIACPIVEALSHSTACVIR